MKAIHDLQREMRAELRAVHQSLKDTSDTADELKSALKEIKSITAELKKTREDYAVLRKQNAELTERLAKAEDRILELENYSRLYNLEIKGLPLTVKDQANEMVKKIAQVCKVPLEETDIDIAHGVPVNRSNDINLIARFTTRSKRNLILAAARKLRLTTSMLGFLRAHAKYLCQRTPDPRNQAASGCNYRSKE
ncbi:hypothetical protein HPB48_019413 [Haemaphysalis longicornis]|uniref:Uncharacterized protein n=1 Tax=Haemaphysalis longicornis TaxID=44386 RepID=A0A9J6GII3_HAELO|nr:hypothetical protein HPB48_019413 [Haemaphysalis longicornis]